jgi:hypothetical protein
MATSKIRGGISKITDFIIRDQQQYAVGDIACHKTGQMCEIKGVIQVNTPSSATFVVVEGLPLPMEAFSIILSAWTDDNSARSTVRAYITSDGKLSLRNGAAGFYYMLQCAYTTKS